MQLHSKEELNRLYNSAYVEDVMEHDFDAGKVIARAIKDLFPTCTRIADIGCSNGVHMRSILDAGLSCHGYDISDAAIHKAIVSPDMITILDLREPHDYKMAYDLAYAIEVIEHIEVGAVGQFIENMRTCAPIFICTPGNQDGTGHFNMQPPTWWIWQLTKHRWNYDIKTSYDLHEYFMNPKWDKALSKFPFIKKGIMVFRQ